jgi:hypothetical protein
VDNRCSSWFAFDWDAFLRDCYGPWAKQESYYVREVKNVPDNVSDTNVELEVNREKRA